MGIYFNSINISEGCPNYYSGMQTPLLHYKYPFLKTMTSQAL